MLSRPFCRIKRRTQFQSHVSSDTWLWEESFLFTYRAWWCKNCPTDEVISSHISSSHWIFSQTSEINPIWGVMIFLLPSSVSNINKIGVNWQLCEISMSHDWSKLSEWVHVLCHEIESSHSQGSTFFTYVKKKNMISKFYTPSTRPPCSFTLHRATSPQGPVLHRHPSSWRGEKGDSRFLRADVMAEAVSQWWLMGGVTTGHLGQCTQLIREHAGS